MSQAVSVTLVALLYALAFAPLIAAWFWRHLMIPVAIGYGILAVIVTVYQVGPGSRQPVADIDTRRGRAATLSNQRCNEVIRLLEQGRVLIDRRNPDHPVVARGLWEQLPAEAREVAAGCLERDPSRRGRGGFEVEQR